MDLFDGKFLNFIRNRQKNATLNSTKAKIFIVLGATRVDFLNFMEKPYKNQALKMAQKLEF